MNLPDTLKCWSLLPLFTDEKSALTPYPTPPMEDLAE
jgi:hypothetical protein